MIDVVCQRASRSARDLSQKLLELAPEAEGTVNWTGARLETRDALNWASRTDKLAQLIRLEHQGVSVPPWDFQGYGPNWYPRTLQHQQGRDCTQPIPAGEIAFYVEKLPLSEEWRLHFFRTKAGNIRLLRSGKKLPKVPNPHPWVRSHRLGWKISYIGGAPEGVKAEGRKAIQALDLDFGAVDIGVFGSVDVDFTPIVLEVNTCPGLESGTLQLYASNILERLT